MWTAAQANIAVLTADKIIKNAKAMTAGEQATLKEDESQYHFRVEDARTQRQMQVTLLSATLLATRGHRFATELDLVNKSITPEDLYQGSRLLNALVDIAMFNLENLHKHLRVIPLS